MPKKVETRSDLLSFKHSVYQFYRTKDFVEQSPKGRRRTRRQALEEDVKFFNQQIAGIAEQNQQYQQRLDQAQQQYQSMDDWYRQDNSGQQLAREIEALQQSISQNQQVDSQYRQALEQAQNSLERMQQVEQDVAERAVELEESPAEIVAEIVNGFSRYGEQFYNQAVLELANALSSLRGQGRPKDVKPLDFLATATMEEIPSLEESARSILNNHVEGMDELDRLQIENPSAYKDAEQLFSQQKEKLALQAFRTKANNKINAYIAESVLAMSGQVANNNKEKQEAIKAIYADLKASSEEQKAEFVSRVINNLINGSDIEQWYETSVGLGEQTGDGAFEFGSVTPRDAFNDYRGDGLIPRIQEKLQRSMKRDMGSIIPGRDEKLKLIRRLYTRKPESPYNPANEDMNDAERQQYEQWRIEMSQLAEFAKARSQQQTGRAELTDSESYNLSNNLTVDLFRKWQGQDKPRVPEPPTRGDAIQELKERGVEPTDSYVKTQLGIMKRDWERAYGEDYRNQGPDAGANSLVTPDVSPSLLQDLPLEQDVIPQYEQRLIAEGFDPEEAREIAVEGYKGKLLNHVAEMIENDPDLVQSMRGFGRMLNSVLKLSPQGLKNPLTGEDLTRPAAGRSAGTEIFFDILEKSADPEFESGLFSPGKMRQQVDYILRNVDDDLKDRIAEDPKLQRELAYEALKRFVIYSGFNFKREMFRQLGKAKRDVGMYMDRERSDLDLPEDIDMGSVAGGFTTQLIEEMGDGDFQDLLAATSNAFDDRRGAGRLDTAAPDDEVVEPQTVGDEREFSLLPEAPDREDDPFEQKKGLVADFVLSRKGPLERELWNILYDENDDRAYLWRRTKDGKKLDIPTYQLDTNGAPKINWRYVTNQLIERGLITDEREIDELTGAELGTDPKEALQAAHRGLVREIKNSFARDDQEIQRAIRINDLRNTEQGVQPDVKEKKDTITDLRRKQRPPRQKKQRAKKWVQIEQGGKKIKKEITEGTPDWDKYKDAPEIPNPDPTRRKKKDPEAGPKTTERPTQRGVGQPQEQGIGRFTKRIAKLRKLMKWNG